MAEDRGAERPTELRTFLIADVRGYTLFTQERGDEAAAKLASRFAGIAREGVDARGGSVIELRGDEALAVFGSARQAIRAAVDLQRRFLEETVADPSLPLPVGIGIDAGEAVAVEGGYRGGALNLAARLCGRAGPGEILASREATHLARRVEGVRYVEEGEASFKNLREPISVVRVVPEDGDPADHFRAAVAERERAESQRRAAAAAGVDLHPSRSVAGPPARRRRIAAVVGAGLIVMAVIVVAALGTRAHPTSAGRTARTAGTRNVDRLFRIDPQTGALAGSLPVGVGASAITTGGGFVWVTDDREDAVYQVSESTDRLVRRIRVGRGPAAVAYSGATSSVGVWVANGIDGTVTRIDPTSGSALATINVGQGVSDIAASGVQVWAVNQAGATVTRIDPASNLSAGSFQVRDVAHVAIEGGVVWLLSAREQNTIAQLFRVDARGTGAMLWSTAFNTSFGGPAATFALDGNIAWVTGGGTNQLVRVDLTLRGATSFRFRDIAVVANQRGVAVDGAGNVWTIANFSPVVHEVSTVANSVAGQVSVGGNAIAIAADAAGLFVVARPPA